MKHLGDITKINGAEVPIVDVITGGSPCQDLSVAGKRAGLAGERSGLFMEQIRIIKEMRAESERILSIQKPNYDRRDIKPRYMVWENVQGAFSSNHGEDFRAVLEETAKVAQRDAVIPGPQGGKWTHSGCVMGNGWSIAWRLHDAQFWGVPQRRKRISLVADFGSESAPEILFERKGVSGDIKPCESKGEETSRTVTESVGESGESTAYTLKIRGGSDTYIKPDGSVGTAGKGALIQKELSGTLGVSQDQTLFANCYSVDQGAGKSQCCIGIELAPTLSTTHYGEPAICEKRMIEEGAVDTKVYGICSFDSNAMKSNNPKTGIYEADSARTLDLNGGNPACNQGGMAVVQNVNKNEGITTSGIESEPILLESTQNHATVTQTGTCTTLTSSMGTGGGFVPMVVGETTSVYRKQSHPANAEQGQGWEQTETNDTLNVYDNSEARTPTLIVKESSTASEDVYCIQGNCIDRSDTAGCNGKGWRTNESFTLNTVDLHAVCQPTPNGQSMESSNWDGTQIASTLTANNANGSQRMPDKENFNAVLAFEPGILKREGGDSRITQDVSSTLRGNMGDNQTSVVYSIENHANDCRYKIIESEKTQTLSARQGTGGNNGPLVQITKRVYAARGNGDGNTSCTITGEHQSSISDYTAIALETVNRINNDHDQIDCLGFDGYNQTSTGDIAKPLTNKATDSDHIPNVCYGIDRASFNQGANAKYDFSIEEDKSQTIIAKGPGGVMKAQTSVVRRLTPLECERLQGYPDNWTNIGEWIDSKGKKHKDADSPRYKALGNSIALPFWDWLASRMCEQLRNDGTEDLTMASLFDGIGGFPFVFQNHGCVPVWASEIEEFPIAVTKIRFPDVEESP